MKDKTYVTVMSNGATQHYMFNMHKETFLINWKILVKDKGYFEGEDVHGTHVVINPSLLAFVEIKEAV